MNYRDAYGIHASNGILFNDESPRRGITFVTRKITQAVSRIKHGLGEWHGEGIDTLGRIVGTDRVVVRIDPRYCRPIDGDLLLGYPSKAREVLGWSARTQLKELVALMVNADLAKASAMSQLLELGIDVNDEGFD